MDSKKEHTYIVNTKYDSWGFLNGYSCKSQDKDHFLRHLGYKFSNLCTMHELNTAYECGDISIKKVIKQKDQLVNKEKRINVVDEYYNSFGYVLEINNGSILEPIIETKTFSTDTEANEWLNSQN